MVGIKKKTVELKIAAASAIPIWISTPAQKIAELATLEVSRKQQGTTSVAGS